MTSVTNTRLVGPSSLTASVVVRDPLFGRTVCCLWLDVHKYGNGSIEVSETVNGQHWDFIIQCVAVPVCCLEAGQCVGSLMFYTCPINDLEL